MGDAILVVDDSRAIRVLLTETLREEGYECLEAKDADEALSIMETRDFSLVISDIVMPGRTGLELLKDLRTLYADTFVVMLTSVTDTETAMSCIHLGAVDYLIKPFSADRLLITVRNTLEQRRLFLEQRAHEQELERKVLEQTEQIRVALQEKAMVAKEMEIAGAIQSALIPHALPATGRLDFATLYRPAGHLGGDYFDLFKRGDGVIDLVIADVAGHNVGSALIVAEIRGALQGQPTAMHRGCGEMLAMLNEALYGDLTRAELFVSMFYLRFDENKLQLSYASAGHNSQLLRRKDGLTEELNADGMIIGVMPHVTFEEKMVSLDQGDRFLLFTDGLVEAENLHEEQFGSERLATAFADADFANCQEELGAILGAMERFVAGAPLKDDLTLLLVNIR
ncbi:SpoIIE family protein phosphatase [Geobacter pelophilus]|uniref:SpoIIE family protein phosphatase n=1 Tax=Geoanaerobacter pelophilus TaxID=60036 RepID=A0AAW4L7F8_9BACT|nr:SpoIIE family protein phosphatase [Geoanaerobacter pelophilus]MBT0665487.1 SpoIIE family protein phosphatase [Geoanaerobacter pelophilus]